jgi:hypothetical protein
MQVDGSERSNVPSGGERADEGRRPGFRHKRQHLARRVDITAHRVALAIGSDGEKPPISRLRVVKAVLLEIKVLPSKRKVGG